MRVLVTGSSGLIGSEAVAHYDQQGADVVGIDNNMRAEFFGPKGDTTHNLKRLAPRTQRFSHLSLDIRDRDAVFDLFERQVSVFELNAAVYPKDAAAPICACFGFTVSYPRRRRS